MTIVIPAGIVQVLRAGLLQQLTMAAEDIPSTVAEHADPAEAASRPDKARALLDRIGLTDRADEQDVTLDPSYREALQEALTAALDGERRAAQQGQQGACERALAIESYAHGLFPLTDVGMVVPADLMPLLVDALVDELHDTASGVAQIIARSLGQARREPDAYAESLAAFDAARGLLDSLAWGQRATIDLVAYREPLRRALGERLGIERDMIEDAADRATEDERRQFQNATRYAGQVEWLMAMAGLPIPAADDDA